MGSSLDIGEKAAMSLKKTPVVKKILKFRNWLKIKTQQQQQYTWPKLNSYFINTVIKALWREHLSVAASYF